MPYWFFHTRPVNFWHHKKSWIKWLKPLLFPYLHKYHYPVNFSPTKWPSHKTAVISLRMPKGQRPFCAPAWLQSYKTIGHITRWLAWFSSHSQSYMLEKKNLDAASETFFWYVYLFNKSVNQNGLPCIFCIFKHIIIKVVNLKMFLSHFTHKFSTIFEKIFIFLFLLVIYYLF